jgi:hypothetical protein
MSARSRARKRKQNFVWVENENGDSTLEDRRSNTQKVRDAVKSNRAVEREAQIASGINPRAGCGAHGETKEQRHKNSRRRTKDQLRRKDFDNIDRR